MAAVMAGILVYANAQIAAYPTNLGGMTADHFVNFICLLCGGFMILMGLFRTGKLISYVPDCVISGFMTGIGLIIWIGQAKVLFGATPLQGPLWCNLVVALGTLVLTFLAAPILSLVSKHLTRFIPGTLFALVVMVGITYIFHAPIERIGIDITLHDGSDLYALFTMNIPRHITWRAFDKAWFYGFELALISYLDTLMVALVIDRLRGETTRKNKELAAQGVANALVGFIGGIPGTQASIRSVMMTQEGATMRLAGMLVGVFVIIEMLLFQDYIELIPKAVFTGILLKVGWNVIDRHPLIDFIKGKPSKPSTLDFVIIVGAALVTIYNLCLAVVIFTAAYYAALKIQHRQVKPHAPETDQLRHAEATIDDV
jgi:SulP family sulfate permease